MGNNLLSQLEKVLPSGMYVPDGIKLLYQWIEKNGFYSDSDVNGLRYGSLYPVEALKNSWSETQREGGTMINFFAEGPENLKYWFGLGEENHELNSKLCVFAQSGAEGSQCAFWLTESGEQKIVHMGSGSGSCLACVLADNEIDFLRLLAIGYDEICWDEEFPYPPNEHDNPTFIKPNIEFQSWVKSTFNVDIPKTALEIVKNPATLNDDASEDAFFNWYQKYLSQ